MDTERIERLISILTLLMERAERVMPEPPPAPDWARVVAFRWRPRGQGGYLESVTRPRRLRLEDLHGIDTQCRELERNTRQFLAGAPANHALLWGSRGTGKSSLITALLNAYADRGMRVVEVERHDLVALPEITGLLAGRPERFILFSDDLSFEAGDPSYKALKAALDGSVAEVPENVLIYATSNRRHLMPEYMQDNLEARNLGGEIHHGEAVEEKISLSERFGLWLAFHPFDQDTYLEIVAAWLRSLGYDEGMTDVAREHALRWALARGSRSGRSAYQFARDWAGRRVTEE